MHPLIVRFITFLADRSGATAIEYGLIATLISVAIIVGATFLGDQLDLMYDNLADQFVGVGGSEEPE